jgi:DNA replicative helicase MCM subunit Mcm2 (Cdc46/Mcm family)
VAAREMLNEFWVDLKLKGEDSNRSLNTILRIADAHAGLALKEVIDVEIAENGEGGLYF